MERVRNTEANHQRAIASVWSESRIVAFHCYTIHIVTINFTSLILISVGYKAISTIQLYPFAYILSTRCIFLPLLSLPLLIAAISDWQRTILPKQCFFALACKYICFQAEQMILDAEFLWEKAHIKCLADKMLGLTADSIIYLLNQKIEVDSSMKSPILNLFVWELCI